MAAILFVCLGNICRSPMAEGAMRAASAAHGWSVEIDSAGTGGWHAGDPPDPRAIAVARSHGVDIGDQRARQFTLADFDRFDHIIAMDHDNRRNLEAMAPDDWPGRLTLALDWVQGRNGEAVADPYYGGDEGFERCWREVTAMAEGLLAALAPR